MPYHGHVIAVELEKGFGLLVSIAPQQLAWGGALLCLHLS